MLRGLWPTGGLWRHPDFLKLWSAETISQFGTQISQLALPLVAVITLDASPFAVAALGVIEFAPFLLFSLPAGVWVDRLPRKPILVIGDLGRAVVLATVPIAFALDMLTIWQLYVVGFVVGICTVFFDVAYQSYLPSLVERNQLVEGNSKLEISRSGAQLAGPGIAGVLVEWLRAPFAILADAVSFVASALFLFAIRKQEVVPTRAERREAKTSMRTELAEGLRWVLGNRYLRTIAMCTATFNFFGNVMFAIFLVYAVRVLELTPSQIGIVFAIGNIGYLAGALTTSRVSAKLGVGRSIVVGAMTGAATLLIPIAPQDPHGAIPYLVASGIISGYGVVLYNVTQVSMRQAITPGRLQGRMNAVMRFIVWGVMPLGSLTGGALASAIDLRTAIWVGAIGMSLSFLPVFVGPVRSLRTVPEPDEPPPVSQAALETVIPGPFPQPKEP